MGYAPVKLVLGTGVYSLGRRRRGDGVAKSFSKGEVTELTSLLHAREHALGLIAARRRRRRRRRRRHQDTSRDGRVAGVHGVGDGGQAHPQRPPVTDTLPAQAIIQDKDTLGQGEGSMFARWRRRRRSRIDRHRSQRRRSPSTARYGDADARDHIGDAAKSMLAAEPAARRCGHHWPPTGPPAGCRARREEAQGDGGASPGNRAARMHQRSMTAPGRSRLPSRRRLRAGAEEGDAEAQRVASTRRRRSPSRCQRSRKKQRRRLRRDDRPRGHWWWT